MANRTVLCPGCGGPTEVRSRSIQILVCSYCSQTIVLTPEGASAGGGASVALTDMFTELTTGSAGRLDGQTFQVLGRVRFAWSDGFWDEWVLQFEDQSLRWLHEDEGELTLLEEHTVPPSLDLSAAKVGSTFQVNGEAVYVTEKRTARIHGGEGQLPRGISFGQEMLYVDAKQGGKAWMLERVNGVTQLFTGKRLGDDAIEVYGD